MSNELYSLTPTQITMYAVDWCPDCRRARLFFKREQIAFLEVNIDKDKQAEAFVKELNNGNRSVPTIVFPDGSKMVEPSISELEGKFHQD